MITYVELKSNTPLLDYKKELEVLDWLEYTYKDKLTRKAIEEYREMLLIFIKSHLEVSVINYKAKKHN